MILPPRAASLALALALSFASPALAQKNWTGNQSNNWYTAGNWNPSGAPGNDDDVVINQTSPNVANLVGGSVAIQGLNVGSTASGSLTVSGAEFSTRSVFIGNQAGSNGALTLIGPGTRMRPNGTLALPIIYVGLNGTGFLGVLEGAELSGNYDLLISTTSATPAELLVRGSSALIDLGGNPARRINIENNARLVLGQGGTINKGGPLRLTGSGSHPRYLVLGAREGDPPEAAGSLNVETIEVLTSAGVDSAVVFNHGGNFTLGLDILGPGRLRQISGTTTLTGEAQDLTQTLIADGMLQVGNGGSDGWIGGNVQFTGGRLAFHHSDDRTFAGVMTGPGTLRKLGDNTLTLTGFNSYSAGTELIAGTLQVGNGGVEGRIEGPVANSGVLAFNRNITWTYAGNVSGSGSLEHRGSGRTVLTGNHSYAGNTTIRRGALELRGTLNQPGANLFVGAAPGELARLELTSSASAQNQFGVVGPAAGTEGSALISGGSWALGNSLVAGNEGRGDIEIRSGATVNTGGLFTAFNSASSSSIVVSGAGTSVSATGIAIGGSGAGAGRLTILDQAQVNVGSSGLVLGPVPASGSADRLVIGWDVLMAVNGPYQHGSAAIHVVGLHPVAFGVIEVSGAAVIQSGARLDVMPGSASIPVGTEYTILSAAGGISGSYAGLARPLPITIIQTANEIRLRVDGPIEDSLFKDRFQPL